MPRRQKPLNDLLFLPCARWTPGAAEPALHVQPLAGGGAAVASYRDPDLLVAAHGDGQPWVAVPRSHLFGLLAAAGMPVALVDGRPVPTGTPPPAGGGVRG